MHLYFHFVFLFSSCNFNEGKKWNKKVNSNFLCMQNIWEKVEFSINFLISFFLHFFKKQTAWNVLLCCFALYIRGGCWVFLSLMTHNSLFIRNIQVEIVAGSFWEYMRSLLKESFYINFGKFTYSLVACYMYFCVLNFRQEEWNFYSHKVLN